jgi:hypothetical protein
MTATAAVIFPLLQSYRFVRFGRRGRDTADIGRLVGVRRAAVDDVHHEANELRNR